MGQYERSRNLSEETLEVSLKVSGETHPNSIRAMKRLASVWGNLGRYDDAEPAVGKAYDISEATHGECSSVTLAVMKNLARTRHMQKLFGEAEIPPRNLVQF